MQVPIKVPTKLNEITLQAYQKYLNAIDSVTDEAEITNAFLNSFLNIERNDAYTISAKSVAVLVNKITNVLQQTPIHQQTFKIGEIEYGFLPDIENITWAEYIDIEDNLQNWNTYHIAMACMYRPITKKLKDTYEIQPYTAELCYAELMLHAPIDVVLASSVFFWTLEKELILNTLSYLEVQMKKMSFPTSKNSAKLTKYIESGDGITQYINYQKETYLDLMKSQTYLCIKPLHSCLMKLSKKGLLNEHKKEKCVN